MRTGYYVRLDGYTYGHTTDGNWWSTTSSSAMGGRYLGTNMSGVYPQYNNYRGYGFAIRCTIRIG